MSDLCPTCLGRGFVLVARPFAPANHADEVTKMYANTAEQQP